jgi:hypothetical protein
MSRIDRPEPGYYRRRENKRWVPALVYVDEPRDPETLMAMDRAPRLICVVNGGERDLEREWPSLFPITEKEYLRMCEDREGVDDSLDLLDHPVRI